MADRIRVGISGWGNVGRGVSLAVPKNPDMELVRIFSGDPRRVLDEFERKGERPPVPVSQLYLDDRIAGAAKEIDVLILCGGSATQLPIQGPALARFFNTVDSFDTHAHIPPYIDDKTQEQMAGYLADVHSNAKPTRHSAVISIGWDPGVFTAEKLLAETFLPGAKAYAFYGLTERGGVSQGHSDAARRVNGVIDARSYTHAIPEAIELVRAGGNPVLKAGDTHWREVFVTPEKGEDLERIANEIKSNPQYYAAYRTEVKFIPLEEMKAKHSAMPHDGLVIAVGETSPGKKSTIEYKLRLDSNPEFTGNVMTAYARAVYRANQQGRLGALRSCLDFTPAETSSLGYDALVKKI